MFMKDIDQQLRFDIESRIKLINFNNIEAIVVNF